MPEQLIFTSKPTGIQPGRSGFQVVAQHSNLHPRLVAALEKESIYEFADSSQALPVICKFQIFEYGSERFHALTRTQSCGVDFTGRPNHIAHHLIFAKDELPACPPAAIFALWKGWRDKWETKPRYLGEWDRVNYENDAEPFQYSRIALPAKTWKARAGDEGAAALPLLNKAEHVIFPFPDGMEDTLIWLFLETQSLLPVEKAWEQTFTNYRIENDNLSRFRWIGNPLTANPLALGMDSLTLDVFHREQSLEVPQHELVEKARHPLQLPTPPIPRNQRSAISIAPFEDQGPIQDELLLNEKNAAAKPPAPSADELLESSMSSNLPDQHPEDSLADVFGDEADTHSTSSPSEASEDDLPQRTPQQRWTLIGISALAILMLVGAIFLAPVVVELLNRKVDPNPTARPVNDSTSLVERRQRAESLLQDPSSRIDTQIGEVDTIIEEGQFLLARAYLSRNRGREQVRNSDGFRRLETWFESQKSILERINRETGMLAQQVSQRKVLPGFEATQQDLHARIDSLAADLQSALRDSLQRIETDYESWLNQVRLKTANIPTFFIPIDRDQPHPMAKFDGIPQSAVDWLASLELFPVTSQIENIRILVSPFRGLNQFELAANDSIQLSLWKQSDRSLISYQSGQAEVIELRADPSDHDSLHFHWRYNPSQVPSNTPTLPEPPIILHFQNALTAQSINVVMLGGISQSVTAPAEVPFSFLELDPENYDMKVMDPVLREKLELFLLPPDRFLRLRSVDDRFHFAWDPALSTFHLYESKELDSKAVRNLQQQISQEHARLNQLNRQETIYRSISFLRNTPLWSLGREILPQGTCPKELETFQDFFESRGQNFFEYLRAILTHFADTYTLIRPSVMEQWVAFPKDRIPRTEDEVLTYRNMLLRTSKRLRSLLKQEDPNHLEHWRHFVTHFEFWLLGEHQKQLLDVLTLTPVEISLAHATDIDQVEDELTRVRNHIESLQLELESSSDLSQMQGIERWLLEIAAMDESLQTLPLILFDRNDS